jgi:hypothetical protein
LTFLDLTKILSSKILSTTKLFVEAVLCAAGAILNGAIQAAQAARCHIRAARFCPFSHKSRIDFEKTLKNDISMSLIRLIQKPTFELGFLKKPNVRTKLKQRET